MTNHYQIFLQNLDQHINKNKLYQTENLKSISGVKIAFSGPHLIENLFSERDITPLLGINYSQIHRVFEHFKHELEKLEIRALVIFEGIHCNNFDKKFRTLLHY